MKDACIHVSIIVAFENLKKKKHIVLKLDFHILGLAEILVLKVASK